MLILGETRGEGIFLSVPWFPGRKRLSGDLHLLLQGQAQECLLEKSMLDNRKSFLVARISAQVGSGLRMDKLLCPWSLMTGLIPTPRW